MVKPPQKRTLLKIKHQNVLQNLVDGLNIKIQNSSNQLFAAVKFFQSAIDEAKQKNLDDFFREQPIIEGKLDDFNALFTSFLNNFSTFTSKDEKLAEYLEKAKQEATVSKLDGKLKNISLSDLAIDENNYEPQFPEVPLRAEGKVIVSSVNSPSDFYVQPFAGVAEGIMKVQAAQQELIDKGITSLPKLAPGMYCVARYSEDFYWYRAKIIDVTGGKVKVFYFDFGNIEIVDPSRIMPMAKSISEEKVQAVACHYTHFKPEGGWSQEAIEAFKEKVQADKAVKVFFLDSYPRISELGTFPYCPVDIFLEDGSTFMNEISAIDAKRVLNKA
ncbi:tudor domain-containing protein 1-like [Tetranychus urticae]|uniref:Tudor domain-containing protein n=1 Tax=Tetranychus urticae TaxID=32264 RepID=T1KYW6_TETUR|nr:tudor domain-containing protein 1-like [Tetranychus urticae]